MGRASRRKRERREEEPLPEEYAFGPEFLNVVAQAGTATATASGQEGGDR